MSYKTLNLKSCYESGVDNLIENFYIPVLQEASSYDRIAGFFSSTSLAIAARGILGLVRNNGKMRLIASPRFSIDDINVIKNCQKSKEQVINELLTTELMSIAGTFERDHLFALGWLIKNDLLQIKVALAYDNDGSILSDNLLNEKGLFHQKVGILRDQEGYSISFSGSINETANGWLNNIEEFKVFKEWEPGQVEFCNGDISKFEAFWNNERINVQTIPISDAIKDRLVKNAPNDISFLLTQQKYNGWLKKMKTTIESLSLFDYQKKAVDLWLGNDRKAIFEMATGTGKTRTAIACIMKVLDGVESSIIIIACPQNSLLLQWKEEIEKLNLDYDKSIVVDSSNSNWRNELENMLLDLSIGFSRRIIIYTTHASCSKYDFIDLLVNKKKNNKIFFIGDEVHGLGSTKVKRSLLECYDYRLGLSATPRRWYDEEGTENLYTYFGDKIFEFSLKDALESTNPLTTKPYLVNYFYYPLFTYLNDLEIEEYVGLSKKINNLSRYSKKTDEYSQILEFLVFKRANIHKSANNKFSVLEKTLDSLSDLNNLIIFVSPDQIETVMSTLGKRGIRAHEFTEKQKTKPEKKFKGRTERQFIVDKFKEGTYQVLVAIKCLDEGIDIPSANKAILLSSGTNPREYIQRLGRVLRQNDNKTNAEIYDVIVAPDYSKLNDVLISFEKKIFAKEMTRCMEIAENALNNTNACEQINNILKG